MSHSDSDKLYAISEQIKALISTLLSQPLWICGWSLSHRGEGNSQIVTSVVTVSHLRMEVYFRHLPRAPLPRQQRASLRQHEIPSAWSSEGVWGAAAAVANVSSSCFHAQPLRLSTLLWNQSCKFARRENWINPFSRTTLTCYQANDLPLLLFLKALKTARQGAWLRPWQVCWEGVWRTCPEVSRLYTTISNTLSQCLDKSSLGGLMMKLW